VTIHTVGDRWLGRAGCNQARRAAFSLIWIKPAVIETDKVLRLIALRASRKETRMAYRVAPSLKHFSLHELEKPK
jgi:hypothetical protein